MNVKTLQLRLGTVAAGVVLAGAAMGQEASSQAYEVTLSPLNNSGVAGKAHILQDADKLTVLIVADGLEEGQPHAQHIHGLEDSQSNGTCPTLAADSDGDNIISLPEGEPDYGPIILPLEPFPDAPDGHVTFAHSYTLDGDMASAGEFSPLENRVVVLHGMTLNDSYDANLPVSCGQIEPVRHAQAEEQNSGGNGNGNAGADDNGDRQQSEGG